MSRCSKGLRSEEVSTWGPAITWQSLVLSRLRDVEDVRTAVERRRSDSCTAAFSDFGDCFHSLLGVVF